MFDQTTIERDKELRKKWKEECQRLYGSKELRAKTAAGIPIKPLYTAADLAHMDYGDIGVPGLFPYTRGRYPLSYQVRPWSDQQVHGFGLAEHTRERSNYLKGIGGATWEGGIDSFGIACDLPTQFGFDPDQPEAKGRVGLCGLSVPTLQEWARYCDGMDLAKTHINFLKWEQTTLPQVAIHLAYADQQGFPREKLMIGTINTLPSQWYMDYVNYPLQPCLKLCVDLIRYCTKYLPGWTHHTTLQDYEMMEAGCNSIQSLAFSLAMWVTITEECIKAGLDPDDFMSGFIFHIRVGLDLFEDVARIRAFRRLWAKIARERFGCAKLGSLRARAYMNCAGDAMTRQEPLNNIARNTIEVLAAVLGGATSIEPCSYDEVWGLPTEESERIAVRTGQIILHETGVANVSDPLAGSYYVESLTNAIEEEVLKLVREIDRLGYAKCYETGWFRSQRLRSLSQKTEELRHGTRTVVGVNKYVSETENATKVRLFKHPRGIERTAVQRIREYKHDRDSGKTTATLACVREEAERLNRGEQADLIPALVEAVKAHASLGEMSRVFQQVFGWAYVQ